MSPVASRRSSMGRTDPRRHDWICVCFSRAFDGVVGVGEGPEIKRVGRCAARAIAGSDKQQSQGNGWSMMQWGRKNALYRNYGGAH